eukprot:SAG31_NODE_17_length_35773_cov_25.999271_42_plen_84_part_00
MIAVPQASVLLSLLPAALAASGSAQWHRDPQTPGGRERSPLRDLPFPKTLEASKQFHSEAMRRARCATVPDSEFGAPTSLCNF